MVWVFIIVIFVLLIYGWAEIYKLQMMLTSLIIKEKAEDIYEDIMKDLDFKGVHNTDKD